MIDAVSTLSVQSSALRGVPQNSSSFASSGGGSNADVYANMPKLGTRLYVRIDSAAERAILEVRASETGEVVNQYPSEAQIKAFQRAEKLAATRNEQETARITREAARNTESVQRQAQQNRDIQTPEPVDLQISTPAPSSASSSVIAPSAPVSTPRADSGSSSGSDGGQSVIV